MTTKTALNPSWTLALALILVGGLAACDTDDETADSGADSGGDVTADTGGDLTADFGGDLTTDSGADATPDSNCLAQPICDEGHTEVESEGDCIQDDAVCYSRSMCGVTIWCTAPDAPTLRFVAGGHSFGECMENCSTSLALMDDVLTVRVYSPGITAPAHEQSATLTGAGVAELEGILEVLADEELDAVYGCPDCDDGGEGFARLQRGADTTHHTWEFGDPPAVLADLADFIESSIDDIEACETTDRLDVGMACVEFE
jgi:hypothetical protein